MSKDMVGSLKNRRIAYFHGDLSIPGGSERVMVEEIKCFERNGAEVYVLTCNFRKEGLFSEKVNADIQLIKGDIYSKPYLVRIAYFPRMILALRKKIRKIRPNIIISRSCFESIYLYFATLFTPFPYVIHSYETPLWSRDARQYASIYQKAFNKIREATPTHKKWRLQAPQGATLIERMISELVGLAEYFAVRKAKKIFACSNEMKWEIKEIYGKEAVVLKGAFPQKIFSYKPKQDIKKRLGISNRKMILSINRLAARKRVDLLIRAFHQICSRFDAAFLVIGGIGPEEKNLKNLTRRLGIEEKVKFTGFIPEEELWDYYAGCDVFAYPDWADFALVPYVALALQKKVVWSTEMEVDEFLKDNRHLFVATPTVDDFAKTIEKALATEVTEKYDLSCYTWERYCRRIMMELTGISRFNS